MKKRPFQRIQKGKLIKISDQKMMGLLELAEYPWLNFEEKEIIFPDNRKRTVILSKHHDPNELKLKVTIPLQFSQELAKKSTPNYPTDMTKDYESGLREMAKRKRRQMMDEEEAIALELAEYDANMSLKEKFKRKEADNYAEQVLKKFEHPLKNDLIFKETLSDESDDVHKPQEKNILNIIDEHSNIKEIIQPEKFEQFESMSFKEKIEENIEEKIEETKNETPKSSDNSYDQGYKEGKERGYQEGLLIGAEKSSTTAQNNYEKSIENISESLEKIPNLKDTLRAQGQDIFLEILKLCSERILKENLKQSNETIIHLFQEIISTVNTKNGVVIEMNANDAKNIQKYLETENSKFKTEFKINDSLEPGQFNIEGESSISSFDIKKNVEKLIDKLKPELFDSKKS